MLQEFYVQSTRASRPGALTHDEAVDFAESLQRFRIQPITIALMRGALLSLDVLMERDRPRGAAGAER